MAANVADMDGAGGQIVKQKKKYESQTQGTNWYSTQNMEWFFSRITQSNFGKNAVNDLVFGQFFHEREMSQPNDYY